MRRRRHSSAGATKPETETLDLKELDEIIERARSGPLSKADADKLKATAETLAWMQQQLANKDVSLARIRALFGLSSSEKTKNVLGDQSETGDCDREKQKKKKKPKRKVKGHGRNGADAYEGADRVQVPHGELQPGAPCPECPGIVYETRRPQTLVRVTGQAPVHATVYELQKLRCNLCGTVFKATPPPGVGDKKYDAKAAAMIGLLKYGTGLPFNRLQGLEGNLGIPLPASTQWEIVCDAAGQLVEVHAELIRHAAQGRLLHSDDTSVKVLDLRKIIDKLNKSGETDRTGIFSTGIISELEGGHRVALFFTGRQHAGENMADLLAHRSAELDRPLQMCDALDRNLPAEFDTIVGNCLAHARRKFVEVVNSFPDECRHVLEALREVYVNDATARKRKMSDEERLAFHQKHSKPVMDGLQEWMTEQIDQKLVEPNSALGSAFTYMTKRWDRFTVFLREPGAPLDNNIAERGLKKAILHRKNSLFYKTENGARIGDLFMGLIHTAELAQANAFTYLTALLEHADLARREPDRWLPWNYRATIDCLAP